MHLAIGLSGLHPSLAASLFGPQSANNKPVEERVWFKAKGKSNRRRRRNYFVRARQGTLH